MGYDIYIGEADPYFPSGEEREYDRTPRFKVATRCHPEAPVFPGDGLTENSNHRAPSYGTWTDFARDVGLYDLFFGARPVYGEKITREVSLMREHPGIALLTASDLLEVRQARERWEAKPWPASERIAGWDPAHRWTDPGEPDPRYDGGLARLLWLEWWITWALANCKAPAIYNR